MIYPRFSKGRAITALTLRLCFIFFFRRASRGGVAHDFNDLLTVISGQVHLLLRGLPSQHHLRKHAEIALRATERATETTRHLLAFSRQQPLKPIATNPNRVVERLRLLIDRLIPANITL